MTRWVAIPHSGPHHAAHITAAPGRPDGGQRVRATVVLRSRCGDTELLEAVERNSRTHPLDRPRLTERQFSQQYGPLHEDVRKVVDYARASRLRVCEVSGPRHSVVLEGSLDHFARAFRVDFARYLYDQKTPFLGHRTPLSVPDTLSHAVAAILGFDNRPLARPHAAAAPTKRGVHPAVVARAYGFPRAKRSAHTIAIMLPYGGFRRSDIERFFRRIGRKPPRIHLLRVGGRTNAPAPPGAVGAFLDVLDGDATPPGELIAPDDHASPWNVLWTVEAALDIELAGAMAPRCGILACLIPDTPRGKFEGFSRALVHPSRPSVISCSWSAHERDVPPMLRHVLNRLFMFAVLRNVTICCSSGDDGAAAGERKQVHFPASSPFVLACGGSTFADPQRRRHETVWNEEVGSRAMSTSGGFSRVFPRPAWQRPHVKYGGVGRTGRAVPDVAAKADFRRGYEIVVGGRVACLGGTSAATPAWAALVASLNGAVNASLGLISPWLYERRARTALHRVVKGTNGTYRARRGWDPCTGLGTPVGAALLDLFRRAR